MSQYIFGFPLEASLQSTIDELIANQANGQYADSATSIRLSIGTTDAVVKAMALDVIDILKAGGEGGGVLNVLANLLKSTMHVLIKQIMGKVSNAEQDKLAAYLKSRRQVVDGVTKFGFVMTPALGKRFEDILARIANGQLDGTRQDLTAAMSDFVESATSAFYDDFTNSLELGFVKKKMVSVGRSTIIKGSNSATSKLFMSMSDTDLQAVSAHYGRMFTQG
ncbi:hypothetical protein DFR26_1957 [Paraperlucidibaca baekdonensis]|uniref:Uncharacterized protein n=1 Tax=Paraperlucidibaca baekdonensis TaxID=748120 RepID=A0A3E0H2S9_9GAMM|nr:hypothetical protein [Paraperlucidibaca baekdonensis]REH36819.1 hypothetical protein DFR26_1957 [Paraperlucidibaca baekdonensis]